MPRALISTLAAAAIAASLITALPQGSHASGPSPEVEDCLVRSAIVPVDADEDAGAEQLREAAARTLQHVLLSRHAQTVSTAELRRDAEGVPAGLRVIPTPGTPDPAALVPALIAQLPSHLQPWAQGIGVEVAETTGASIASLCAGLDRVLALDGAADDAVVSAAIDHADATLRVGLDPVRAAHAAPAARPSIDALPRAIEQEAVAADESLVTALGLDGLGVPLTLVADTADAPVSRMHDSDGYGGGNAIRVSGLACTTGFAVRTADRAPAVMSAGHCAHPHGSNDASVVSGHASTLCGLGSGEWIGRVSQNLIATSARVDSMIVRTGSARPTMWLGSGCTGSGETAVHGAGQVAPGTSVGFSGARQGEQYASRTSEPAGCYDFGFWACSVYRAMSPRAVPPYSNYACLPGDSGGPTFRHRSGGGVIALGVIVASGYDLGINRCSWVDMGTALHLSGATIMTHTSLTMAPPTRIAGGDRYATAALISRQGYPNGAREVYVASGQLFPDALSAGAAAAHVRAPLLLTADRVLPTSTEQELRRLAPTSIVLVGGEPSVSAEVESGLAAIAPVARIAGADRYETSAMIALHAFPDGADAAFIATGRGFPDALSAGPVAAMRQAPILLVDGIGTASEHTLAALRTLGTSHLTVVGGTPSVRDSVVSALREGRSASRVAGEDRYATAVRLNWAFAPTPPALYVAAGNQFADALAASALAGARGMPLYLTPATCLSGLIPGEHARLGRPPVVLLGGTPTLSHDVTRYELCG